MEPLIDSPARSIGSDFNGDGIADIGIAARSNDDAGSAAGAVYILYGAGALSQTYRLNGTGVDVTILGSNAGDQFAYMGGAGDVNSDGFDDLIVGADSNDNAASNAGAVYIVYGSPNLAATINISAVGANVTIVGKAASDFFGRVAGGVGDFNGDGFDDVAGCAPGNDDGPLDTAGAVYMLFGSASLSTQIALNGVGANVTILGKAGDDQLGVGGAGSAGDVNLDGLDDLIIGTSENVDGGSPGAGAVYVLFGTASPSATYDLVGTGVSLTILGKNASDKLATSASFGVGDVNGDGFADMLAGAYGNDDAASAAGAAYIIYGRSGFPSLTLDTGNSDESVKILGDAASDQLGRFQASSAGDMNDDGFFDVTVGARYNDDGPGSNAGAQYVIFGGSSQATLITAGNSDMTVFGRAVDDQLGRGRGFSGLGDVNDDGFPDFMTGGRYDGATNTGAVYIIFGSTSPSSTINLNSEGANVTILGKAAADYLGLTFGSGRPFQGP